MAGFKKKGSCTYFSLTVSSLFHIPVLFLFVQDYMSWCSESGLWGGQGGLHPEPTTSSSKQAEEREIIG